MSPQLRRVWQYKKQINVNNGQKVEQSEKATLNDMSKRSLLKLGLISGSFTLTTMRCKQLYVIRVPQRALVLLYSSSYRLRVAFFFCLVIQNIARSNERHIYFSFFILGAHFQEDQSCVYGRFRFVCDFANRKRNIVANKGFLRFGKCHSDGILPYFIQPTESTNTTDFIERKISLCIFQFKKSTCQRQTLESLQSMKLQEFFLQYSRRSYKGFSSTVGRGAPTYPLARVKLSS